MSGVAVEEDFLLSSYRFDLPDELIAQNPPPERGSSRLYLLDREYGTQRDSINDFKKLPDLLPPQSLLIANNSRVAPARLQGCRAGGGRYEFLLLTPVPLVESAGKPAGVPPQLPGQLDLPWQEQEALALLRPQKKMNEGEIYSLAPGLGFVLIAKEDFGQCRVRLLWQGGLSEHIGRLGSLPLPPYIRRPGEERDNDRYQTVYADRSKAGSVAAPTAGLHFTIGLQEALLEKGHEWGELSLYVGYGTFSPVRVLDIRDHQMHPEYVEIPGGTVEKILRAKADKRPVIAVGTTSARALEGLAELLGRNNGREGALLEPYEGWLNCFIHPGRLFRVIDGLLTNFHLPESTLLMLVSALAGRKRLLEAYRRAVENRLRFFSYGDAMLIV